ncbi:Uncharacterised protein [Serratia quinivorans]|nr:Uncharacterised protein [Serratia quinivorans]
MAQSQRIVLPEKDAVVFLIVSERTIGFNERQVIDNLRCRAAREFLQ